eukprot:4382257-Pyramimonas_sp.AAC.1
MASHDVFATSTRALKTDCVEDFYVEHLSALGRHIRSAGDDHKPRSHARLMVQACTAMAQSCDAHSAGRSDVLSFVPFFSGNVKGTGPHSFGTESLRLAYLTATICSIRTYFSQLVIIGVCDQSSDYSLLLSHFRKNKISLNNYLVEQLNCSGMTNNLPSQLLRRGQQLVREQKLEYKYMFFTESDHVVSFLSVGTLEALLKHLDDGTYIAPYRLEESYFKPRGGHKVDKYAARRKDTTGSAYEYQ